MAGDKSASTTPTKSSEGGVDGTGLVVTPIWSARWAGSPRIGALVSVDGPRRQDRRHGECMALVLTHAAAVAALRRCYLVCFMYIFCDLLLNS